MSLNEKVKLAFRLILIIGVSVGLYIKTGLYDGNFKVYTLIYFTNLSNIFVLIVFLIMVLCTAASRNNKFLRIKGSVMMSIILTGIVYNFVLLPSGFEMAGGSDTDKIGSLLLHLFSPLMTVLDWIINDKKGVFNKKDPIMWAYIPLLYFVFTVIQANLGGFIPNQISKYPYEFIAVDLLGWSKVMSNIAIISIVFILMGYGIFVIDRLIAKLRSEK